MLENINSIENSTGNYNIMQTEETITHNENMQEEKVSFKVTESSNNTNSPLTKKVSTRNRRSKKRTEQERPLKSKPNNKKKIIDNMKKRHHLVIGTKDSTKEIIIAYSDKENLRGILVDFVRMVDESRNKTKSILFADTLSNLTQCNDILCYNLLREIFGYKINLITEINSVYYGLDFLKELKNNINNNNEPFPF